MGIVRTEYIIFAFDSREETIMQCVEEISEAILQEERLKELGVSLKDFYS